MLIHCKECGNEISDTAKHCPHCGAKVKKEKIKETGLEHKLDKTQRTKFRINPIIAATICLLSIGLFIMAVILSVKINGVYFWIVPVGWLLCFALWFFVRFRMIKKIHSTTTEESQTSMKSVSKSNRYKYFFTSDIVICTLAGLFILSGILVAAFAPFGRITVNGMLFDRVGQRHYTLEAYYGKNEHVEIPSKIRGLEVTEIYSYAFHNSEFVTEISIPNTINTLHRDTFKYCKNLKYNEYDNALYLGNKQNPYVVLVKAKSDDIESCNIAQGAKIIHDGAFFNCEKLNKIIVPNSIERIFDMHLHSSSPLDVYISDLVAWCNISFGARNERDLNEYFFNGDLYLNEELVTELIIPEGVEIIKKNAFKGCKSITKVIIPNSVRYIEECAFDCSFSLKSIIIPSSVDYIGLYAISGGSDLTIYAERDKEPDGWYKDPWDSRKSWNPGGCPVVWEYKG